MTPVRIALPGAAGRMGRMIAEVIGETEGARLTAALERPGAMALGQEIAPGVVIGDDIDRALGQADVAIDFTAPDATARLVEHAVAKKVAMVIGTTGLASEHLRAIEEAARSIPIVRSANMSLGVNVLFGLLAKAARALGDAYDVEVVELHHRQKKDAPSGTALEMARVLAHTLGRNLESEARHGREGQVGARTQKEIGLHAVRGGDIVGEHTAYFCGLGERLELTHKASSRETFARGAVRAALWLHGRPPGLYDMQDVLSLRA